MSAREVILNAIPPQFNDLPFQIPPTNPAVQPYVTYLSDIVTIPANTTFLDERFTIVGANIPNRKVVVSCKLEDGIDYTGDLPFGISTWIDDAPATDILVSFWNETANDEDVRVMIVNYLN